MMSKRLFFLLPIVIVLCSGCAKKSPPVLQPTPVAVTAIPQPSLITIPEEKVVLEIPKETDVVTSPSEISGFAPGTWFFEGQIRGEVVSEAGQSLATFPLKAVGDWMTEQHVRFTGEVIFKAPKADKSVVLIIKNDNPSGLPENEKSQTFTLRLKQE
jgi:hypothetical protein